MARAKSKVEKSARGVENPKRPPTPPNSHQAILEALTSLSSPEAVPSMPPGAQLRPSTLRLLWLALDVVGEPRKWLCSSNPNLGNRKPIDLLGTDEEQKVYDILRAVDQGLF